MAKPVPTTILRQRYERSRTLDPEAQMRECVDYLQNPDVLVSELLESFCAIESLVAECPIDPVLPEDDGADVVLEDFYDGLVVSVSGDPPFTFQCLDPLACPLPVARDDRRGRAGLDYIAWAGAPEELPVFGTVISELDNTPYLALFRGLVCLSELAAEPQLERMNEVLFKGALPPRPIVDLHIVVHDFEDDSPVASPLYELTHDLADRIKSELLAAWQFPDVLRSVACLRMPPVFESVLTLDWRV